MQFFLHRIAAACVALTASTLTSIHQASAEALAPDLGFDAPEFVRPSPATRIVLLPDGKFLRFFNTQTLVDQRTGPITRYFADGTVDASFRVSGDFDLVGAVAAVADGRVVIAAVQREYDRGAERVLRLNADGSVDRTFKVSEVNGLGVTEVQAIVPVGEGKILVSGLFSSFDGARSAGIVQLLADGTRDPDFNAGSVTGIGPAKPAVQADGKIVIAGSFRRINNFNFPLGVARLNADGSLDTSFQPSGFTRLATIRDPLILPDGKIILGGRFSSSTGGRPSSVFPLVRLHSNGAVDQPYGGGALVVRNLALQADGKVVIAEGSERTLFRYNPDGTYDGSFQPPGFLIDGARHIAAQPITVTVQPNNQLLIGGNFTEVTDGTLASRYGLARFNPDGTVDASLTTPQKTGLYDFPDSLARLPDGTTLVGFSRSGGAGEPAVAHGFGRLRRDGSLDASFDPIGATDPNGSLTPGLLSQGFRLLPDARIFVFGTRGFLGSFTYGRLTAEGTEDKSFAPDAAILRQFADSPDVVLPQLEDKMLIGSFTPQGVVNGSFRRIASDGSLDSSFQLDARLGMHTVEREEGTGLIYRIIATSRLLAVQPDGRILFYDSLLGLVRLNRDGDIDESFAASGITAPRSETFPVFFDPMTARTLQPAEGALVGDTIVDTATQPDGRIIIVGPFTEVRNTAARGIARLTAAGLLDDTFAVGDGPQWREPLPGGYDNPVIEQVEVQSDGKLLVVGNFEQFNGVPAPGIVSLNADGSVDTSFVAPAVRQKTVGGRAKLQRQADGSFLLSGPYSYPGESSAPSLLRIVTSAVANISTRMAIGTGENVLIGGFIITGNAPKRVIIRAIGPSLRAGNESLSGRLADPLMELRGGTGELLMSNDDWRSTQQQEIISSQVPPLDDRESAIVATLNPGAYTAIVSGQSGSTGIGLVEVYDLGNPTLDPANTAKLANISTRGFVQTGDNVMIGGFIVTGTSSRVIVRAIGPTLSRAGVAAALQDTTLEFVDGNGSAIGANDNWRTGGQEQQIIETTLQPNDDREAAILATLNPGAYTAVVRGKDGSQGVALVEVYALP